MSKKSDINFSTIMASSVHDMKNSLGVILNTAETLGQDDNLKDSQQQAIDLLHMEGERLNNTFIQLLALYRIVNKQYTLNIDSYNIFDCLEEAMFENETVLDHNNIKIEIQCDRQLEWFFDRTMTMGIINTTINNALRYANRKIILTASIDDNQIGISILDDGSGYPDKMLDSNNDEQTDISFSSGNTGLGLHFANVIAEMHKNRDLNGHIEISNSGINGGGKFSIFLP